MGREIRSVPKGWEHPKDKDGRYIPLFDQTYKEAAEEWADDPADSACYRPEFESEPVCYQVYENVSEGTPTSPVFESLDDLEQWLVSEGYSEKAAAGFIEHKWAPSFVVFSHPDGTRELVQGIESFALD